MPAATDSCLAIGCHTLMHRKHTQSLDEMPALMFAVLARALTLQHAPSYCTFDLIVIVYNECLPATTQRSITRPAHNIDATQLIRAVVYSMKEPQHMHAVGRSIV